MSIRRLALAFACLLILLPWLISEAQTVINIPGQVGAFYCRCPGQAQLKGPYTTAAGVESCAAMCPTLNKPAPGSTVSATPSTGAAVTTIMMQAIGDILTAYVQQVGAQAEVKRQQQVAYQQQLQAGLARQRALEFERSRQATLAQMKGPRAGAEQMKMLADWNKEQQANTNAATSAIRAGANKLSGSFSDRYQGHIQEMQIDGARYRSSPPPTRQIVVPPPAVGPTIGAASEVTGAVVVRRGDFDVPLHAGDPIHLNDRIITGADARLRIALADDTVFTVGPHGDMVLDDFVYDPATQAGRFVASITKGVFRFVTGKMLKQRLEDQNVKVKLGVGILGIRGTDYTLDYSATGLVGTATVEVFSGIVDFTDLEGVTTSLVAGEMRRFVGAETAGVADVGRLDPDLLLALGRAHAHAGNHLAAIAWLRAYLATVQPVVYAGAAQRDIESLRQTASSEIEEILQEAERGIAELETRAIRTGVLSEYARLAGQIQLQAGHLDDARATMLVVEDVTDRDAAWSAMALSLAEAGAAPAARLAAAEIRETASRVNAMGRLDAATRAQAPDTASGALARWYELAHRLSSRAEVVARVPELKRIAGSDPVRVPVELMRIAALLTSDYLTIRTLENAR